jgi:hypothetical protein
VRRVSVCLIADCRTSNPACNSIAVWMFISPRFDSQFTAMTVTTQQAGNSTTSPPTSSVRSNTSTRTHVALWIERDRERRDGCRCV